MSFAFPILYLSWLTAIHRWFAGLTVYQQLWFAVILVLIAMIIIDRFDKPTN